MPQSVRAHAGLDGPCNGHFDRVGLPSARRCKRVGMCSGAISTAFPKCRPDARFAGVSGLTALGLSALRAALGTQPRARSRPTAAACEQRATRLCPLAHRVGSISCFIACMCCLLDILVGAVGPETLCGPECCGMRASLSIPGCASEGRSARCCAECDDVCPDPQRWWSGGCLLAPIVHRVVCVVVCLATAGKFAVVFGLPFSQ